MPEAKAQSGYRADHREAAPTVSATASIRWLSNPDQAMAFAKQSGRPILAYITSDHCGYCRKMERESWSHPAIAQDVSNGFIALRLDAKQHATQVQALKVRAFPTTLLLTAEGQVATGAAGYLPPAKLAELLKTGPEVALLAPLDSSVATR